MRPVPSFRGAIKAHCRATLLAVGSDFPGCAQGHVCSYCIIGGWGGYILLTLIKVALVENLKSQMLLQDILKSRLPPTPALTPRGTTSNWASCFLVSELHVSNS